MHGGASGCRTQASASHARAVLTGVYHELRQLLPLSFALGEGPIVVTLRPLEWGRFEDIVQVRECA